jgi:catechol 2,3-dioxygenase-like lactoylglutathione lyase family enzyme
MAELPAPPEGIVLTHFIVSDDVERSRRFYTEVLGGRVVFSEEGGPTNVALSNSWIVINQGGGPTDDKPEVTLETPRDVHRVSSFLNIRVKDIEAVYAEWSARGANFLTAPKHHQYESAIANSSIRPALTYSRIVAPPPAMRTSRSPARTSPARCRSRALPRRLRRASGSPGRTAAGIPTAAVPSTAPSSAAIRVVDVLLGRDEPVQRHRHAEEHLPSHQSSTPLRTISVT